MGEKGQKTKEFIRQKAYELFATKGFKEVTMTDLCASTGLSRGGLYRHYSSTAEILAEILSEEYVVDERINHGESAKSILNTMLALKEEEIMEKEYSLSLAIYEYANLGNEELFVRINGRAKERWSTLITYGIQTGGFNEVAIDPMIELILYYYQGLRMWSRVVSFSECTANNYAATIRKLLLKHYEE